MTRKGKKVDLNFQATTKVPEVVDRTYSGDDVQIYAGDESLPNKRLKMLHKYEIQAMIKKGPIQFVEWRMTGSPELDFKWIPTEGLPEYYREAVDSLVYDPGETIDLDEVDYQYRVASYWGEHEGLPLVLIECFS